MHKDTYNCWVHIRFFSKKHFAGCMLDCYICLKSKVLSRAVSPEHIEPSVVVMQVKKDIYWEQSPSHILPTLTWLRAKLPQTRLA